NSVTAHNITVSADDESAINVIAGAASVAAAFAGEVGVAFSVGVALAHNKIDNEVEAYVHGASTFTSTAGPIKLSATENAYIFAVSAAASLGAAVAGEVGIAVSGAGAEATNAIFGTTKAYVEGTSVQSAGDVSITATNSSAVEATIIAASLAVGGGGEVG